MVIVHILGWWYSRGWIWVLTTSGEYLSSIFSSFSVGTLLRTLFSPWKQIQTQVTFRNFIQSQIDNFISRFIGAIVRLGMLLLSLVITIVIALVTILALVSWVFIPLFVVLLPIVGVKGGL